MPFARAVAVLIVALICTLVGRTGSRAGAAFEASSDSSHLTTPSNSQGWAPWTDLDFVHSWGGMPIPGRTSLWLFTDELASADFPGEGDDCPDHLWIGLSLGTDGALRDDAGDGGIVAWDAIGELNDLLVVPLPAEIATTVVEVDNAHHGPITITIVEHWVAGTMTGSTGHQTHVTGLASTTTISGDGLIDGPILVVTFYPDRSWPSLADAQADVLKMAILEAPTPTARVARRGSALSASEIGPADRRKAPGEPTTEQDCYDIFIAGENGCILAYNADFDECEEAYDDALSTAKITHEACVDNIDFDQRLRAAMSHCAISGGAGAAVGGCMGGLPGLAVGGVIGTCVGGVVGVWRSGSILRADCARAHRIAVRIAEQARRRCLDRAEDERRSCVRRHWARYEACVESLSE